VCKSLDTLDQDASVPGAVEHDDLPRVRQLLPEALQIMLAALVRQWRGDRIDLEAARIEGPAQPADDAALARRVPAFKLDDGALPRAEIGLLHRLHDGLHRLQTALIVCKVDRRMVDDVRKLWAAGDQEILWLHVSINVAAPLLET